MPQVKYIGKKEVAPDLWYGSGKTWLGNGDVHQVTDSQARRLIAHADEFALVVEKKPRVKKTDETDDGGLPPAPESNPEKMDAEQLAAFALETYGQTLPSSLTRMEMLNEVLAQIAGPDAAKGSPA